jgi:hypothetical protein
VTWGDLTETEHTGRVDDSHLRDQAVDLEPMSTKDKIKGVVGLCCLITLLLLTVPFFLHAAIELVVWSWNQVG